jgi:hypothetical protein
MYELACLLGWLFQKASLDNQRGAGVLSTRLTRIATCQGVALAKTEAGIEWIKRLRQNTNPIPAEKNQ